MQETILCPVDPKAETVQQQGQRLLDAERAMLERYASFPPLREFASTERMPLSVKWGATFGVALVIGETLLLRLRAMVPTFETTHRVLLMLTMRARR